MVRIAVFFAVGILSWPLLQRYSVLWAGAFVLGVSVVAMGLLVYWPIPWRWRWCTGVVLVIGCWSAGVYRMAVHQQVHGGMPVGEHHLLVIRSLNNVPDRTARYEAELRHSRADGTSVNSKARVLLTLLRDSLSTIPVPGDLLLVEARMRPIARVADPGGFDRVRWASERGIVAECVVPTGQWIGVGHTFTWTDVFGPARASVQEWLLGAGLRDRERAIVKALLLGMKDELDQSQRGAFARSGTMHVLAVSGMHVGLIYAIVLLLLRPMGQQRWARWVRAIVGLCALWSYAGLTGAAPSVLRATVMFSLFIVASLWSRRSMALNALFAAGLLLLMADPFMLRQLSFQLSFLAVLGIVMFHDPLAALWDPPNRVLRWFWALVCVSVAAQLATTPLSMFVFKAFPTWFLPANLVVVTLVVIVVHGGLLLLLVHPVPVIGAWVAVLLGHALRLLDHATAWFATLPAAYPAIRIGPTQCLLLYLFIAGMGLWLVRGRPIGRHLASVAILSLGISWWWRADAVQQRTMLAVLDRRGTIAVLWHGREAVVLGDTTAMRIDPMLRATGARLAGVIAPHDLHADSIRRSGPTWVGGAAWMAPGCGLVDLGAVHGFTGTQHAYFAAAIIRDARDLARVDVHCLLAPDGWLVVPPDVDARQRGRIRRRAAEQGVRCHDVRRDGAFIFVAHDRRTRALAAP